MELLKPTVVTLQSENLQESSTELSLPVLIEDKILLTPGTWNGVEFSAESIKEAYDLTDWSDKQNYALIYDHDPRATNWLGNVLNPRINELGELIGDLEIWDMDLATKLVKGGAKLGISARVLGIEDDDGNFLAKQYNNFSVVYEPACKNAYINLAQMKEQKGNELVDMLNNLVKKLEEFKDLEGETGQSATKGAEVGSANTNQPIKYKKKKDKEKIVDEKLNSTESLSEGSDTDEKGDISKESKMTEEETKKVEESVDENESQEEVKEEVKEEAKEELSQELSSKLDAILESLKELSEKLAKEELEEVKEEEAPAEEPAEEEAAEEVEESKEEAEELEALKEEVKELKAEKEAKALSVPEVSEAPVSKNPLLGRNLSSSELKLRDVLLSNAKENGSI